MIRKGPAYRRIRWTLGAREVERQTDKQPGAEKMRKMKKCHTAQKNRADAESRWKTSQRREDPRGGNISLGKWERATRKLRDIWLSGEQCN